MKPQQRTWLGGIKEVLSRAETTHQPRPEGTENVVDIPQGLDKLRRAIVAINNEMVEAQAERDDIQQARLDCLAEIQAHLAKNVTRQRDAAHRMKRLQEEWVQITLGLGIRAELVLPPICESVPSDALIATETDNE